MMRKLVLSFWIVAVCVAPASSAGAADAPENWRYERPVPASARAGFVALELDPSVLERSQEDLDDLRILTASGEAKPLAIVTGAGSTMDEPVRGKIILSEKGQTANVYTFETEKASRFNRVRLESPSNFIRKITVEGSVDNQNWNIVRKDILVYQCSSRERYTYLSQYFGRSAYGFGEVSARVWNLSFLVPPSVRYRYVRVTVPHDLDKEPVDISGIHISMEVKIPPQEIVRTAVVVSRTGPNEKKESEVVLDFGAKNLPMERIEIVPEKKNFSRVVRVLESTDAKEWRPVSRGTIYALETAPGNDPEQNLTIDLAGERRSRYFKLVVSDGDNTPLGIRSVSGHALKRYVVWDAESGTGYILKYGHPGAKRPDYDVSRLIAGKKLGDFGRVRLGEEVENTQYVYSSGKAWTDDRPYLIWGAMGLVAAVMILLALGVIKKAG